MGRPQVVIIGAGFGGLTAAEELKHAPVDVTLVDRHNFHTFQPLLYQVATAGLNAADVAYVVRDVFLPLGLVDNKVCAIDDTWSGLRVVWRKERRAERRR